MIQIDPDEKSYAIPVDLRHCNIKLAKNIVIKTIQECYSTGISRRRFLTANASEEELNEDQEKISKHFPKWLTDSSIKHSIINCVKHDGSYVVYIQTYREDMDDIVSAPYEPDTDLVLVQHQAAKGDMDAQYVLGLLYLDGDGVEQSTEEALRWLRKAAKQGDVNAQLVVARILLE